MTRVEDAGDGNQLFNLAISLEDTNWLQNDDKRRTRAFVDAATRRIELSRLPTCSWWQLRCKAERKAMQQDLDKPEPDP